MCTVDGSFEIQRDSSVGRKVVYPIIYGVLGYIQTVVGHLGFLVAINSSTDFGWTWKILLGIWWQT